MVLVVSCVVVFVVIVLVFAVGVVIIQNLEKIGPVIAEIYLLLLLLMIMFLFLLLFYPKSSI